MTKTKPEKEQILEDIDTAIYEVPVPPKIEIGDPLLSFLSTDAEIILTADYENPEELQDRAIEQIREEYKFDEMKDAFYMGQNIMTNNSLSIHMETRDIFYNDFNTKENFYNFLLAQQDELKQFIPKQIPYHDRFEKYTRSYLLSFSLEELDELDLLSNKNAEYLLYKFNDWSESMGAEKVLIRHTSKVRDEIGLQENRGKR